MFDLPDAKRIRRSDLYTHSRSSSRSRSPSPLDPALSAQLQSQLANIYGSLDEKSPETPSFREQRIAERSLEANEDGIEEEQVFEFRLFSTTANPQAQDVAQKINLDEEDLGDGAFVLPHRELAYYIAGKAEGERKHGFEIMALSGDDILRGREKRHWGLEVPWRVRILKVQGKLKGEKVVAIEGDEEKGKRPGKKRRIILREKKKAKDKIEKQKQIDREKKEEFEKEKRTRRNREKKVKRKAKEKAEKAKKAGAGGGDDSDGDGKGGIKGTVLDSAKAPEGSGDKMDVDQSSDG